MGGLTLFAVGRVRPGFLQGDVHRGVDHARLADVGAGEEHELGFVEDAVGLGRALGGHRRDRIDPI